MEVRKVIKAPMFEKIEKELIRECERCSYKQECKKTSCIAYRVLKIINAHDIEVAELNIDDFFEASNSEQITLFG